MGDQLNAWLLFDPGSVHCPDAEIVTRRSDGSIDRVTYAELGLRTQRLMHALDDLQLDRSRPVGTLAWNGARHLEAYLAVPCTGRVLHTLNVRLSPEELAFILKDADDQAVLVDVDFLPLLEQVRDLVGELPPVIVLDHAVPESGLPDLVAYEDLLNRQPDTYDRIDIDETEPMGLCYTSGTTGRPKGVVYTHRSTFLHALAVTSAAGMSVGPRDSVLPQVPMFHANAWGMPYAAAMVGAKQVLFGGALDAKAFVDLLVEERVTVTAGVPTVWLAVAEELATRGPCLGDLRHIVCGGSQPPAALILRFREEFGIELVQAWGMTETSPLASVAWPQERMRQWSDEDVVSSASSQAGLPLPGVRISIRDTQGHEVERDGATMGDLWVRGPWVVDGYLHGAGAEAFGDDGWFRTGDVAIGSSSGYFVIADRTKDLIKSGGEWISSVDLEAAIMKMDAVAEAAVIAVPDPRWLERPLACVVLRSGHHVAPEEFGRHLRGLGFAGWQVPDRFELVDEIPKTSVGKFDKKVLRAQFVPSG
jgi:fatty-acyl-CoA synthase